MKDTHKPAENQSPRAFSAAVRIPQTLPNFSKLAEREGFRVMRSAHATAERVYPRVRVFVYTSTGAHAVAPGVGPRWRPGSTIPRAGEAEPNALGALARHAEEGARVEREESAKRRRAA